MSGKRSHPTTDPPGLSPGSPAPGPGSDLSSRGSSDELALLSAFLDGELSAKEEADLLETLSQRPDLQDALDALAEQIAGTVSLSGVVDDEAGALIAARVMAELDPQALPADVEAAETLAQLSRDGASTPAQDRRLDQLLDTPSPQQARIADAVCSFVAAADVARAAVSVDELPAYARSLQSLPEHVLARVERTERGWALSAAAVDGELGAAEANELAGLCGADDGIFAELSFQAAHARHAGEALRAAADSPQFMRLAERAGAAALQAITAVQMQDQAQREAKPATSSTTTSLQATPSFFERLRGLFGRGLRSGPGSSANIAPLLAASAALFAFVIIGKEAPAPTQPDPKHAANAFAALQQAFVDAGTPQVMADNRSVPTTELAVIGDNSADVEAIDATGTTVVFSTAESNITVIWVAELDDETDKEQGT